MNKVLQLITLLSFTLCTYTAEAQQISPNNTGSVKGLLQDTVHNYTVKSATISVYRADSTLINYQLSNNYGEFSFGSLPLNAKYYIEVSHISYQLLRRSFELSGKQVAADLKTLILKPKDVTLEEVQVGIPPIQMNGDTLEFNAAAFKLDSNAVVEDLLRQIPNVTLWGDGQITVNGREVKSLLVNGKEFFGGNFKMALQNISKNALDKVQVYNVSKNQNNPLDSTLTVNLKLKKGKNTGHFGKVGGGYGTADRFEADGSINFFAPKLQIGIVAAANNVNKIANDMRTLNSNNTFKGTDLNVEYQPDFRANGINRTNTGGATLSYNFIELPTYENKSVLTANYFVQNKNNDVISNSQTTTSIAEGTQILDNTSNNNNTLGTNQTFDSKFEYAKLSHRLNINQNLSVNTGESNNQSWQSTSNQENELTSTNNTIGKNKYNSKSFALNTDYSYNNYLNYKKKIKSHTVRYNLNVSDNDNKRSDITSFRSFGDTTSNRDYNRTYNTNGRYLNQQLFAELPQLKRLFFGNKQLANIDFKISNDLKMESSNNKSQVADFNNSTNDYTINTYLSNNLHTSTITEMPSLSMTKSFSKSLSNRFNRSLNFSISAKQQFTYQNNRSDRSFQNINRNYNNFIPQTLVNYYKDQYGEYSNNASFSFQTYMRIPTVEQLAPLIDSSNVYWQQKGNTNLRESKNRGVNLYFYHTDQRGKNTLNYNLYASLVFTSNYFTDSTFIDNENRRTIYLVNADGARRANYGGEVRKSLKLKTSELQLNIGGSLYFDKNPGYVNNEFSFSHNQNISTNLGVNYTYKDKLVFEAKENLSFFNNSAYNIKNSGSNTGSAFSGSYKASKKLSLNSNISLNNSKQSAGKSVNYNIWNASAAYRLLKGNNAEFKITALDLLRQNNSIRNTSGSNSYTFASVNVLQQYFMTTFSYYPRQFGKNTGKK